MLEQAIVRQERKLRKLICFKCVPIQNKKILQLFSCINKYRVSISNKLKTTENEDDKET